MKRNCFVSNRRERSIRFPFVITIQQLSIIISPRETHSLSRISAGEIILGAVHPRHAFFTSFNYSVRLPTNRLIRARFPASIKSEKEDRALIISMKSTHYRIISTSLIKHGEFGEIIFPNGGRVCSRRGSTWNSFNSSNHARFSKCTERKMSCYAP